MLCYSTASLPKQYTAIQISEILLGTKFKGVEWSITSRDFKSKNNEQTWAKIRETLEDNDLVISNVHLGTPDWISNTPHQPSLSSLDEAERTLKVSWVEKAIEFAEVVAASAITLTSGPRLTGVDLSKQEEAFYKSVEEILPLVPGHIECMVEQEPEHTIHSTPQLIQLLSRFSGELKLNFDIGHSAVLDENILNSLQNLKPYILNLHIEDIAGTEHRHLLFGEGTIQFDPIFKWLKESDYTGNITPDLYPYAETPKKAIASAERLLSKYSF